MPVVIGSAVAAPLAEFRALSEALSEMADVAYNLVPNWRIIGCPRAHGNARKRPPAGCHNDCLRVAALRPDLRV